MRKAVHRLLCQGFTDVVDADLSKYFDTIPHDELLRSVAARIVDRYVLRLVKLWLKAPVEEMDPDRRRRMSGGKQSTCGTPQGGVISPLLANRYINRFLRHWRRQGRGEAFRAHVVNYANDFVILSRGHAEEVLAWTRQVMTKLGLTVNEAKTTVRNARQERFDFLSYSFGPHHYRKDGHRYLGASPSTKSVQRLKARVGEIMHPTLLGRYRVRKAGRAPATSDAHWRTADSDEMKPVGSRMREIRTSGLMSGDGKRGAATAPVLDSTRFFGLGLGCRLGCELVGRVLISREAPHFARGFPAPQCAALFHGHWTCGVWFVLIRRRPFGAWHTRARTRIATVGGYHGDADPSHAGAHERADLECEFRSHVAGHS